MYPKFRNYSDVVPCCGEDKRARCKKPVLLSVNRGSDSAK